MCVFILRFLWMILGSLTQKFYWKGGIENHNVRIFWAGASIRSLVQEVQISSSQAFPWKWTRGIKEKKERKEWQEKMNNKQGINGWSQNKAKFFSFRRFLMTLFLAVCPATWGGSLNMFRVCWEETVPDASDKEPYLCSASIGESHPGPWKVLRKSWWHKTA